MTKQSDVVLFSTHGSLGRITLNSEGSLNALSLDMINMLTVQLRSWEQDPKIKGVFLDGAGEKAFCAGGDIRRLYESMLAHQGETYNPWAESFFVAEYALDHLIHTYTKPVCCWGTGFVMGGGMGLYMGSSLRVVTETSRLSMPEISIGLYPDVGATFFLQQLPPGVGAFLGLSGTRVSASDALAIGWADVAVASKDRETFVREFEAQLTQGARNIKKHFSESALCLPFGPTPIVDTKDDIKNIFDLSKPLHSAVSKWQESSSPVLSKGLEAFQRGSPTSAAIIWQQLAHSQGISLEQAFLQETTLTMQCALHTDFREGVRALIIDKDNNPKWNPATLNDVPQSLVKAHFKEPWAKDHPLRERLELRLQEMKELRQ